MGQLDAVVHSLAFANREDLSRPFLETPRSGFLLAQTSGLLGRAPVTTTTAVATVNGEDILATTWYQTTQNLEQDETQRSNQSISLDERQRLMDQAYDQLVTEALLQGLVLRVRRRVRFKAEDRPLDIDTPEDLQKVLSFEF